MGYYTRYNLEIDRNDEVSICSHNRGESIFCPQCGKKFETIPLIDRLKKDILAKYQCAGFEESDEVKWYDHENDMKQFSLDHPDILFTLRGYGEENEDIWIKFFKNGKMQEAKARIEFDSFDDRKLK